MPGYIEVTVYKNNSNQATVKYEAQNNQEFNKLEDYVD